MTRNHRDEDSPHDILAAEEFGVGAADPSLHRDEVHDVLAAEEFALGTGDPSLHRDEAHDVLAAEEFALGTADPALHHGPLVLPPDPTGIAEPHDVLAAEEFAMPAAPPGSGVALRTGWRLPRSRALLAAVGALWLVLRRRRRS